MQHKQKNWFQKPSAVTCLTCWQHLQRAWSCTRPLNHQTVTSLTSCLHHLQTSATSLHRWHPQHSKCTKDHKWECFFIQLCIKIVNCDKISILFFLGIENLRKSWIDKSERSSSLLNKSWNCDCHWSIEIREIWWVHTGKQKAWKERWGDLFPSLMSCAGFSRATVSWADINLQSRAKSLERFTRVWRSWNLICYLFFFVSLFLKPNKCKDKINTTCVKIWSRCLLLEFLFCQTIPVCSKLFSCPTKGFLHSDRFTLLFKSFQAFKK